MSPPDEPRVVLTERRGAALVVRLDRPQKRNAINRALSDQLMAAVAEVEADPALRVGVLASATPGMFCAGADLEALRSGELLGEEGRPRPSFTRAVRTKPWIAAAGGAVLGGGLEMALACEMIVAAEGAMFGLPEVRRGVLAAGGGVFRLPRVLPRAVAMEMLLTGRPICAERALALGLINAVVAETGLIEAACALAEAVGECAPLSVARTLEIARVATDEPEESLWPRAHAAIADLLAGADSAEGVAAFKAKRPPVWVGR